jgi:hypothetical protein
MYNIGSQVKLCSDMGLKEATEYATELKKAERAKEVREQRASSSRPGTYTETLYIRVTRDLCYNFENTLAVRQNLIPKMIKCR